MILCRNRNLVSGLVFGLGWLAAYGILLPNTTTGGHSWYWSLVALFALGTFGCVVTSADPISRAGWVLGAVALASFAVFIALSGDTNPEGKAWVWFYATMPLGPIALMAGIALAARFRDLR